MAEGPVRRRRDVQQEETRAALVEAARERFGTDGFADTPVAEVATAAGVTIGALYHHFPAKADLFAAVLEAVELDLLARSSKRLQGAKGAIDALQRSFAAYLDAVLEPPIQRIVLTDGPSVVGIERYHDITGRYAHAGVVSILQAADAAGELRRCDIDVLARLLLGACTEAAFTIARAADQKAARRAVGKELTALVGSATAP